MISSYIFPPLHSLSLTHTHPISPLHSLSLTHPIPLYTPYPSHTISLQALAYACVRCDEIPTHEHDTLLDKVIFSDE
jgi:predicted  nucleic acid-binding Zn ribbon protein